MKVLITGGAGFIGTHLARRLLKEGCEVSVLDNFSPQIHGGRDSLAPDLAPHVRLHKADVRDGAAMAKALDGAETVVHLAAETGTGQSMYEINLYEEVNLKGTAILADYLVNNKASRVEKLITASSRAIYGEGKYRCQAHGTVYPAGRRTEDMKAGRFEPRCPACGEACETLPTDEESKIHPSSFYGLTKQVQEQMTLLFARTRGIDAAALRYQNVYGPGQSLKNPYTGILAIFSNQAREGKPIFIFEDGKESRDFVYIADVVEATWRCIRPEYKGVDAFNVGSGHKTTVSEVVHEILAFFQSDSKASVTGQFREGDIRHNVADLAKARRVLGFESRWTFRDGIREFLAWATDQEYDGGRYERSLQEMRAKGLMHG